MASKEFESLRREVSSHQEKIRQDQELRDRNERQKEEKIESLIKQRVENNINLLKTCGISNLFEEIKSEKILDGEIEIYQNSYKPDPLSHSIVIEDFYKEIDNGFDICLSWDKKLISGKDEDGRYHSYNTSKRVKGFIKNGEVFIKYTCHSSRNLPPEKLNGNLYELVTKALVSADQQGMADGKKSHINDD